MSKAKFVYVVYIRTTVEKAWQALVEGEVTRQYWDHENVSDWKVGSPWKHQRSDGSGTIDMVGNVVEVAPPKRLVITWAYPADAADMSEHTRVTFELEQIEDMIRLTVTHDELEAVSNMERGIMEGWPRVLSSMKSFLETGRPLKTWAGKRG